MSAGPRGIPETLASRPWLLPVACACLCHLPALFGTFVYDDVRFFDHPAPASWPAFLALGRSDYGLTLGFPPFGFYRPGFTMLACAIRWIVGPNAPVFHACALAVLGVATWLVTRVAARLGPRGSQAFPVIAGLLYAVHPARVETVSLVTSLPDLVVEVLALALVCLLLPDERSGSDAASSETASRAASWRVAPVCAGFAFLATLFKESAFFVIPALAGTAALAAVSSGDPRQRRVGLAAAALAGAGLGWLVRLGSGVHAPVPSGVVLHNLAGTCSGGAVWTVLMAVRDVALPGEAVFWRIPAWTQWTGAGWLLACLVAAIGACWGLALRRRLLPLALLIAWCGANVVNLLILAASGYPYSERYLALAPAILLLCLGAQALIARVGRRRPSLLAGPERRRVAWLLLAGYLAAQAGYTLAGSAVCLSPLRFFMKMHAVFPRRVVPVGGIAELLNAQGGAAEEVEACVREATAIDATHVQVPLLHNLIIQRYLADRRYADALRCATWSLGIYTNDVDKLVLRAAARANLGNLETAISDLERALVLQPACTNAQSLRGQILRDLRKPGTGGPTTPAAGP